ncbi:MAG: hypothetical protein OEW64_14355 [Gammaproteobacteria bacterium]|nr:hypothetical protein [Gammaproteobacteria bacterium]
MNKMRVTFAELKRRNVFRVALAFVVTAWLLLQVADVVLNNIQAPRWVFQSILLVLAIGFPVALIFSWVYEVTPEGIRKEKDVDRSASITAATARKLDLVTIGLLVTAIAFFGLDRFLVFTGAGDSPVAATPEVTGVLDNSIAVLPFVNMSDDAENEYFSDGLSEELLNGLVRNGGLKVTGRTSSFAFKNQNTDLREIGRVLNVAHVLEGSVRKSQNRVRITAQLVKTADGYHVWSDTFDRELDDVFAIQQEIATHVTRVLHGAILGETTPAQSDVPSAGAYEEYLRGMYVLQQNLDDRAGLMKAREHFARALELEPDYVDGFWGMFKTWDRWHRNGHGSFEESAEQMAMYAAELERLAPGSEQALIANARSATVYGKLLPAYEILEDAAKRFPGSSEVLARYGDQSRSVARYEAGITALREAIRLDPLSLENMSFMASILHRADDCDGIEDILNRALDLNANAGRVRYHQAMCIYENGGNAEQALAIVGTEPVPFLRDTAIAILKHRLGDPLAAQRHVESMLMAYGDNSAYQFAQIHAQWGETSKALDWLETAHRVHDPGLMQINTDDLLDPLRDEPRFARLIDASGLRLDF